ncbi:MAG: tripartite tricarboxylate transporter TctB family protein [Vulcanimicrobiaceae bacterium]
MRRSAAYTVILCCAAYLYYLAEHIQYDEVAGRIGPDAWPKIVLVLLFVTCAWQIGRIVIFGAPPAASLDDELPLAVDEGDFTYLALLAIGVTVVFAYLLPWLGFLVATILFLAAIAFVGRYRRPWPMVATSIIAPIVLIFVFMKIVYVALPLGVGPFKDLTVLLLRIMRVR